MIQSYGLDGLGIAARIEKQRNPESKIFQIGESGRLYVQAVGYAEIVEIIYPEEWTNRNPSLNRRYIYETLEVVRMEEMEFMVPLQIPEGEYTIIVKAYKADRVAEAKPELLSVKVEGSVLDEIRTRLR